MTVGADGPRPGFLGRPARAIHWVALAVAVGMFTGVFVLELWHSPGDDLSSLVVAGELLRRRQSDHLYDRHPVKFHVVDSPAFIDAARAIGFTGFAHPFVQAPLVAHAMKPLAALPFPLARRAWLLTSIAAVVLGVWLTFRAYLSGLEHPLSWALVLGALCLFEPLRYGLWLGQTTPFIFLIVVAAIALERARWPFAAGFVLAFAAFLKITPALLALVWLWRGPRRAMLGLAAGLAALAGLSLAVAGIPLHRAYLDVVRRVGAHTLVAYNNQSIVAFLTRFTVPYPEWFDWKLHPASDVLTALALIPVVAFGIAGWWLLRRVPSEAEGTWRPLGEAVVLLVMLLGPSLSWSHYFLLLLPVLAACLAAAPSSATGLTAVAVGVAFALCCRPITPDQVAPRLGGLTVLNGPMFGALVAGALVLALATLAPKRAAS